MQYAIEFSESLMKTGPHKIQRFGIEVHAPNIKVTVTLNHLPFKRSMALCRIQVELLRIFIHPLFKSLQQLFITILIKLQGVRHSYKQ